MTSDGGERFVQETQEISLANHEQPQFLVEQSIEFDKEIFIEEVRKYECLWNIHSPSYKDRNKKMKAWSAIGLIFQREVEFLQKQLKYLKDNLKRCLDKRSKMFKSGAGAGTLPKCQYFDQMYFLHEKTVNRPSISNITIPTDPSEVILDETPTVESEQHTSFFFQQQQPIFSTPSVSYSEPIPLPPSPPPVFSDSIRKGAKRKRPEVESNPNLILTELSKLESEINKSEAECEDSLFCRSLIPTLKKLEPRKNKLAKIKISQLLFEMEFEETPQ